MTRDRDSASLARLLIPAVAQIVPVGVLSQYQPQFLFSIPAFDLFLARDRGQGLLERLDVNQLAHVVTAGEAVRRPGLVFPHTPLNVVGESYVERVGLIRHHVDVIRLASRHARMIPDMLARHQCSPFWPCFGGVAKLRRRVLFVLLLARVISTGGQRPQWRNPATNERRAASAARCLDCAALRST